MSENQNCKTQDFSQYDQMETQELEAILRQDAESTGSQESDTEKILYIAGVLVSRENENNTGNNSCFHLMHLRNDGCGDGIG